MAQTNEFLQQSILAFSALHIAYTRPISRDTYCDISYSHHKRALHLFRAAIVKMTPLNCSGLFACSALILFFSLGLQSIKGTVEPDDSLDEFINILAVLKSSWYHFAHARSWIDNGPMGDLRGPNPDIELPQNAKGCQDVSAALDTLDTLNQNFTEDMDTRLVFQRSIHSLRNYFDFILCHPSDMSQVLRWLQALELEFMDMLRLKGPMALVILAHWCISVYFAPHRWFMDGWVEKVIASIAATIDPVWRQGLCWPLQQVQKICEVSAVNISKEGNKRSEK